jgi:hypothetical protein
MYGALTVRKQTRDRNTYTVVMAHRTSSVPKQSGPDVGARCVCYVIKIL